MSKIANACWSGESSSSLYVCIHIWQDDWFNVLNQYPCWTSGCVCTSHANQWEICDGAGKLWFYPDIWAAVVGTRQTMLHKRGSNLSLVTHSHYLHSFRFFGFHCPRRTWDNICWWHLIFAPNSMRAGTDSYILNQLYNCSLVHTLPLTVCYYALIQWWKSIILLIGESTYLAHTHV